MHRWGLLTLMELNMDIPSLFPAPPAQGDAAPPPAKPDGRAVADAVATKDAPRPDIPLPLPATPAQVGIVSAVALAADPAPVTTVTSDTGVSERTLKPYGIFMLPDGADPSDPQPPRTDPDTPAV